MTEQAATEPVSALSPNRRLRNYWTAHRLRVLLQYGLCPECDSSPPGPTCTICVGSRDYGPQISVADQGMWAHRYVRERARA